mmetsp:Transcript_133543/g.260031  ORF Transcript_133543/g.260031 Transcript_133543/m.260031 type:complete len:122 (-) Transcript_133543:177-542(-)
MACSLSYSKVNRAAFSAEDDKEVIVAASVIGDADVSTLDELECGMPPLARQAPGWLAWSCSTLTVGCSLTSPSFEQESFVLAQPAMSSKSIVPGRKESRNETCSTRCSESSGLHSTSQVME